MVVGGGMLATAFLDAFGKSADTVIFASGVANSQERSSAAFMRERRLLEQILRDDSRVVYFSTCSVYDPELAYSPYVTHKRQMEELVRGHARYAIFRLPQVVGRTANPKTLSNFLYNHIVTGRHFDVWRHAKRNLIDVADVASIAGAFLRDGCATTQITNIACPYSVSVLALVGMFERVVGKKAFCTVIDAGSSYEIDTEAASAVARSLGISFDESYVERVLIKYYGQ